MKSLAVKLILIITLLIQSNVFGQLIVNSIIIPPYSPYLADYTTYENKMVVTITNTTQQMHQVKLMGSITGNGISISIPPNYKPNTPITVPPSGTVSLSGAQLAPYYNSSNLIIQGISEQELVNGNGLPEGNYTFCFYAAEYTTSVPLSNVNAGCSNINITHFEPPFLLQPVCDQEVLANQPQNMIFSWTVPAGANPAHIEYELTVVELLQQQQNPDQALNAATNPTFFRKTVPINNYLYTPVDPFLEAGKTYAWRVRAMPKPGQTANFKNNGFSKACTFVYKSNQNDEENEQILPEDQNECFAQCENPLPQNNSPYSPKIGDNISVGKFNMKINTINGQNGTGEIHIPFLNVKVPVSFSNLQVNTDLQAIGQTKVVADVANNALIDHSTSNDPTGEIQMTKDKLLSIQNHINQGTKRVSQFNENLPPVALPFSFDNNGLDLMVVGLIFTPEKAYLNTIFGYEMSDWFGNELVDFSMKGICIRPNGFGAQPKIGLKQDIAVPLSEYVDLTFLKGDKTYITLGCDGITDFKLSGEYVISRDKLIPVENGKLNEGNLRVKVPFEVDAGQGGNWVAETSMVPESFTTPDAKDFVFTASNIILDMHEQQNANGMKFHTNHPKNNGFNLDWKGLYLGSVSVQMPDGFLQGNNAISFSVSDLLIDKTGFWGDFSVQNLVSINNGSVGNWQFSIQELTMNFESSSLAGGGLNGDIVIPISETGLAYTAIIQKGNNGVNFEFQAETQDELEANLWLATLNLEPGSTVSIEKNGNQIIPAASLNGSISIGFAQSPDNETALSNLALNGIKFQELEVIGGGQKPTVNLNFVALNNQPNGMFGMNRFPINLTGLGYDNGITPGITFGLKLNLSKGSNAFEASSDLKIKAKWDGGLKRFKYDGIDLQQIEIDADLGVMSVVGSVNLYKEHETYGTGFRGDLEAQLKFASIGINATIQVGKIGEGSPVEETNSNYRYFFIDIGARWGVGGLPIPGVGALAFYGFGGGIYRNMDREMPEVVTNDQIPDNKGAGTMTPGESRSGVVYVPKKGTFGFMASTTIGTTGEPTSFNSDLKLTVQFNTDNFGVTKVGFDGNAYLMGPITDRNIRLLQADVTIQVDFEQPMFHASVTIEGGFNQSKLDVSVAASLNLHFEPGLWYIKLGEWTNEDHPWLDPKRIQANISLDASVAQASLNFNAYFMMGNDIGDLPKSPLAVRQALKKPEAPKQTDTKVFIGKGFALGAGIKFDASVDFAVFYAAIEFILGADVLLAKTGATCNGNMDYGLNGWYAKGSAYAYLRGDVGIRLRLWGFSGSFSILEFIGAAEMKAELPNPNWIKGDFAVSGSVLNGVITVNTRFGFEVGQKCTWGDGSSSELPIIADIKPEIGEEASVFEAPQASFNFAIGEQFTVKDFESNKKGVTRTFRTQIVSVTLKQGNIVVPGNYHLNNAKTGITFIANEILAEEKEHVFTVQARIQEWNKNTKKWDNKPIEKKSVTFNTGIKPDYIATENVVKAYPQREQRYFLYKDEPQGDITVGLGQCYLLDLTEDNDFKYKYILRFTNLETKQTIEVPFTCNGKNFTYNMPNNLSPETVYELKFLRVAQPKQAPANTNKNTEYVYRNEKGEVVDAPTIPGNQIQNIPPNMMNLPNNMPNNMNIQANNNQGNLNMINFNNIPQQQGGGMQFGGGNNNNQGGGVKLKPPTPPASKLVIKHSEVKERQVSGGSQEKELFAYYFRTSKHATAQQKFNAYSVAGTAGHQMYYGSMYFEGPKRWYGSKILFPLLQGQENMDIYDAYGYVKQPFNIVVEPLAKTTLSWGNNSYFQNLNNRIYEAKYKNNPQRTSNSFKSNRNVNMDLFGLDPEQKVYTRRPIQGIKVWHSSTEGPINIASNQQIMQPRSKLTNNEINLAKQGVKIMDQNPKNPVLPLNIYLPILSLLDGNRVFHSHRSGCWNDHWIDNNRLKCRKDHALPAVTHDFNTQFTVANPYDLTPGLNYPFTITYGYLSNKPYQRQLNFKP